MMRIISFFILILIPLLSIAGSIIDESKMSSNNYFKGMSNAEIDSYCEAGHGGTIEQDFCAKRDFEKNDVKLNITYQKVVQNLKNIDTDITIKTHKVLPKLIKAQKLWIAYRDAECDSQYAMVGNGSMRNQQFFDCKSELTKNREQELQKGYF